MESDVELLASWMGGSRTAGQELVQRHYRAIYSFFHTRLDPDDSADLTQATFETLCLSGTKYRGAVSFRSYLRGIGRWKLVAHYRRQRSRKEESTGTDGSFVPTVGERSLTSVWSARERESRLVEAMRRMTLDDQLLLELKEYEGFTAREIAETLQIPPGTVATRLRRARRELREQLDVLGLAGGLAVLTGTSLGEHMRNVRGSLTTRLDA